MGRTEEVTFGIASRGGAGLEAEQQAAWELVLLWEGSSCRRDVLEILKGW